MRLKYNKEIYETDDSQEFKINNKAKTFVARDKDKIYVNVGGENFVFKVIEDDDFGNNDSEVQNENRAEISAPMPGRVIKVNVKLGDKVDEGDSLLVVEAMKMETKLYSPITGIVKEINASPDQQVSPDDVLIVVEI